MTRELRIIKVRYPMACPYRTPHPQEGRVFYCDSFKGPQFCLGPRDFPNNCPLKKESEVESAKVKRRA